MFTFVYLFAIGWTASAAEICFDYEEINATAILGELFRNNNESLSDYFPELRFHNIGSRPQLHHPQTGRFEDTVGIHWANGEMRINFVLIFSQS